MVQDNESSPSLDSTGLINPLVSQLSVDPYVDMDTRFVDVLANDHVVGDSHTTQGSLSTPFDISSVQCCYIRGRLTIPLASHL